MTSLPTHGSIEDIPVPKLLLDLYRDHYSGGVSLEFQRTVKKLLFHEGAPVAADSVLAGESLCVLLSGQAKLSDSDVARVKQTISRERCEESAALLSLGLIAPRELIVALKELVRRRTIACFSWADGSYTLLPDEVPAAAIQAVRVHDKHSVVLFRDVRVRWLPD